MPASKAPFMKGPASLAWQKMTMMRASTFLSSSYCSVKTLASLAKVCAVNTVSPISSAAVWKAAMPAAP